MISFFI